ncbi:hypothetical protein, partial [Pseudomonas sp.]|uniref:hypothetical protein n=1 Tax=Pseudomonas sp. TaxID=306 RepID=UPI0028A8C79F
RAFSPTTPSSLTIQAGLPREAPRGRRSISQALKMLWLASGGPDTIPIKPHPISQLPTSEPTEIKSHKNQENPAQRVNTGQWL